MKPTITRLPEIAKALATEAGKQLADPLNYFAQLAEQTLRALRNSLTFEDNFDCSIKTAQLRDGVEISLGPQSRQITEVRIRKIISPAYGLDSFLWYIDLNSNLIVVAGFTNSPAATLQIECELIIYYR